MKLHVYETYTKKIYTTQQQAFGLDTSGKSKMLHIYYTRLFHGLWLNEVKTRIANENASI